MLGKLDRIFLNNDLEAQTKIYDGPREGSVFRWKEVFTLAGPRQLNSEKETPIGENFKFFNSDNRTLILCFSGSLLALHFLEQ